MRDQARLGVVPNFRSALDDGAPRRFYSASPAVAPRPATRPVGARPRRSRWIVWIAAELFVAGGAVAAVSFVYVDAPLSRAAALSSRSIAAALASVGYSKDGGHPTSSQLAEPGELIVRDQKGLVDRLVPLGISVKGGSGGELVVLDGLVEGTQVSAGTSLTSSRWSLPAKEVDQAFVAAPKGFSGTMELSAKLYSSRNELAQIALVRLEWSKTSAETSSPRPQGASALPASAMVVVAPTPTPPAPASSQPVTPLRAESGSAAVPHPKAQGKLQTASGDSGPPVAALRELTPPQTQTAKVPSRARSPEEIQALLQVGQGLLRQGDIAAARLALRRAAEAGSAEAARDLGRSFDPEFLRRIGMADAADLAQAAEWFAKARELGSPGLSSPSQRLATMPEAEGR